MYWAAVVSTFALGTTVGDLTAITFGFGYGGSAILYAAVIGAIAVAHVRFGLHPIVAFSGPRTWSPAHSAPPSPTGSPSRRRPAAWGSAAGR